MGNNYFSYDSSQFTTNTSEYVSTDNLGNNTGLTGVGVYKKKGTGHMVGQAAWEPQRTNNFELVIEGLQYLIHAGGDPTNTGNYEATSDFAERLMLSVDSFTAPAIEITPITTQYGNNSIKWAGKPDFPNSSLVINDYIGIQTEEILSRWFRCAYDFVTESVGLAANYKKTAFLMEYAPNGGAPRVWRLDGCWLASFNLGEWSQEGNAQRKLNATLIYDRVVPDYGIIDTGDLSKKNIVGESGAGNYWTAGGKLAKR